MKIPVRIYSSFDGYKAKVIGKPFLVSCTAGEQQALQALIDKYYGEKFSGRKVLPHERGADSWKHWLPKARQRGRILQHIAIDMTHVIEPLELPTPHYHEHAY